ncbi:MAG: cupin domain-containing protein [Sphingomonadaceae bacterium]
MTDISLSDKFAIGLLSPAERADVARQRLYDPELDRMIDDAEAALSPFAGMAGCARPPAGLKDRVLNAVQQVQIGEAEGKHYYPFVSGSWRKIFPGVDMKELWVSGPKLLRCAPISVIPAHHHHHDEYLAVLAGDFTIEGTRFGQGDCLFSPQGTRHNEGTTESGCVLLLHHS